MHALTLNGYTWHQRKFRSLSMKSLVLVLLGFNASATARVISRRWNDDDEISFHEVRHESLCPWSQTQKSLSMKSGKVLVCEVRHNMSVKVPMMASCFYIQVGLVSVYQLRSYMATLKLTFHVSGVGRWVWTCGLVLISPFVTQPLSWEFKLFNLISPAYPSASVDEQKCKIKTLLSILCIGEFR